MKKRTVVLSLALVGSLSICQSVTAAEYKSSLGAGVGLAPDYEGSEDYEAVPMLYARTSWGDGDYLMLSGTQLRWNLLNDRIEFGPLLQWRPERDDVDSDQVDNLKKVDDAFEAGFFLTGIWGPWRATMEFAADVSGEHDGFLVTLGGDYKTDINQSLEMTFGASMTYASDNYMETYFQIDSGNRGTSTLPDYSADDGEIKDIGLRVVTDYKINPRWTVSGTLAYTHLLGDAADSPIVDDEGDEGQYFIGVMGIYRF